MLYIDCYAKKRKEANMKKHTAYYGTILLIIVSFCLAATPVSAKKTKTIKIFLLGGQSNMVGAGKTVNLKPRYNKPFSRIKIWNPKTKRWSPLSPEVVNEQGQFGPEISFGHALAKAFRADDIRLVKYAAGGTALYNDWSPRTEGGQYVKFMRTAKAALADLDTAGVDYEISGMLWLQGESDAKENMADTYEKNLSEFIADMRTQFKTPKMPFVIARVRNYYGGSTGQAKIVRDAQVNVAKSTDNVAWFDTDDCSMLNPGHYNAAGLIEIGKRFAEKYKEIVSKTKKTR
jgi:hypothetical protein